MGTKILIVDDSSFMRMTLKDILQKAGFEVVGEANDSKTAIERFKEVRPDLVTMDIVMPGEDGVKTLKEIMSLNPQARVLMVSALGQEALIVDAMGAGARGYITKPFKPENVVKEVRKNLQ